MVSNFETIYLGSSERKNKEGVPYHVVSFMDEGEPVTLMLARDFDVRQLPKPMTAVNISVRATLGRYQRIEVLSIGVK